MAFRELNEARDRTAACRCRLLMNRRGERTNERTEKEKVRMNKCRPHVITCAVSQGRDLLL